MTDAPKRRMGRPRLYAEPLPPPYSLALDSNLFGRLDAELSRRVAADPHARPFPRYGDIMREALANYLPQDGAMARPATFPPAPSRKRAQRPLMCRLSEEQRTKLDAVVTYWAATHPTARPLPARAMVLRHILDLYLTDCELAANQPELPLLTGDDPTTK